METIIIIVFVAGYLAITLEHSLKIDKLVPALVMMAICWAFISFGVDDFKSWFDSSSHKLLNNFFDFSHEEKMVLGLGYARGISHPQDEEGPQVP